MGAPSARLRSAAAYTTLTALRCVCMCKMKGGVWVKSIEAFLCVCCCCCCHIENRSDSGSQSELYLLGSVLQLIRDAFRVIAQANFPEMAPRLLLCETARGFSRATIMSPCVTCVNTSTCVWRDSCLFGVQRLLLLRLLLLFAVAIAAAACSITCYVCGPQGQLTRRFLNSHSITTFMCDGFSDLLYQIV